MRFLFLEQVPFGPYLHFITLISSNGRSTRGLMPDSVYWHESSSISDLRGNNQLLFAPLILFHPLFFYVSLHSWCYRSIPSMDSSASCSCVPRSGWRWASTSPCSSTTRGGDYVIPSSAAVCVCLRALNCLCGQNLNLTKIWWSNKKKTVERYRCH